MTPGPVQHQDKKLWVLSSRCSVDRLSCGKDGAATTAVRDAGLQVLSGKPGPLQQSDLASVEAFGVEQDRAQPVSAFMSWRNLPSRSMLNTNHISPQGSSAHSVQVP